MKERLFLDGITLHAADISPRHVERSTLIETYFADTGLAVRDWTAVATRVAADTVAVQFFVEIALADLLVENFPQ